jgi:tetratricopeptide (TPR) repeat protein
MKGRYFWNRLTREGVAKAFEYFEEAKSRDDGYAHPWSGLADAYAVLGFTGFVTPKDAWPLAIEAAQGALERDADLPEARVTLGLVRLFQDWDWRAAEDELERALALDPHSAAAHQWYALFLDPLSVIVATMRGFERDLARDYAGSEAEHRKALELDPHHFLGRWGIGVAHQQLGRYAEAVSAHEQASALLEHAPFARAVLARSLALAGRADEARAVLDALEDPEGSYVSPYQRATVYEALGDRETALRCLEEAALPRDSWLVWIDVDPMLDGLRGDPRFAAVRARVMKP